MKLNSFARFFRTLPRRPARRGRPPARLARPAVKALEDRTLMSTFPATTLPPAFVTNPTVLNEGLNPQVVVDPINPTQAVEVDSTGGALEFRVHTSAGWSTASVLPTAVDPNASPVGQPPVPFAQVNDVSITFDRTESFYIVALEHDAANASGAVVLNKFNFSGTSPVQTISNKILYSWLTQDPAFHPVVAADTNQPTFHDVGPGGVPTTQTDTMAQLLPNPDVGQTGQVAKAVYVAWNTEVTLPNGSSPANLSELMVTASDDGGQTWTTFQPVRPPANTDAADPHIVFTQGNASGSVPGGEMLFAWDQSTGGQSFNQIAVNASQPDGGVAGAPAAAVQTFPQSGSNAKAIGNNTLVLSQPVTITNAEFGNLADLSVTLNITDPNTLAGMEIDLTPPTSTGIGPITLISAGTLSGNNLGVVNSHDVGTVLDQEAARPINDKTVLAPYVGHYQQMPPAVTTLPTLASFVGMKPSQLDGTWTLSVIDHNATSGATPPQVVDNWSLNFTSVIQTTGFGPDRVIPLPTTKWGIPLKGAVGDVYPTTIPAANVTGVGPGITVAADNTLGAYSPYAGRIYIAYTGTGVNQSTTTNVDTDVFLISSDDGGVTWSTPNRVNNDAVTDGFSEGNRVQFTPALAVDQATGTVVVTYYDARYDAADVRVSNSIQASTDGGATFSPSTYLNQSEQATDAITGNTVTLEPIPGNETQTGPLGFGDQTGLAVYGGNVYTYFTSNLNSKPLGSTDPNAYIMTATVGVAGGPRGIQGDMGPVTAAQSVTVNGTQYVYDNVNAGDGHQEITGFVITFDRPVDPNSFFDSHGKAQVNVQYQSPFVPSGTTSTVAVASVTPLDLGTQFGPNGVTGLATTFLVQLATPQGAVGTYSYAIGPLVSDRIRTVQNGNTQSGNPMDQDGDGNNPTGPASDDEFAVPKPVNGIPFQLPYATNTQPLIIPGAHVVQTYVPGQPTTPDNTVVNQPVSAINVVFDRDMGSFTPADIVSMMGPAGPITGPFTVTADPLHTGDKRTFQVGFPAQTLTGTYTLMLSAAITDASGNAVDNNLNAGVAVTFGGNPAAGSYTVKEYDLNNANLTIAPKSTLTVPVTVPDNFVIVQNQQNHIQVRVNISFPNDPDLTAQLVAPNNAATVTLFSGVGAQGTPPLADFSDTTFDDFATSPIQKGVPPFNIGPYNPQSPLSALAGLASGGTWNLVITNAGTDGGTLNDLALRLPEAVPGTGLGEPVADQTPVSFKILVQDPTNPLSSEMWTPVGPASANPNPVQNFGDKNAGRVNAVAIDPSDPSGNTAYAGTAGGGVWKTTDFLTTNPNGPTWVPLTNLGPTNSVFIRSLAVVGRNNDPNQTIVFATTSIFEGGPGVGLLRSEDGGQTWQVLDSTTNANSAGSILPMNSTFRDHKFVGSTGFKVVADPNLLPNGQAAVYVAFSTSSTSGGVNGVWRSIDSGNTWQLVRAGEATDVILAAGSAGANGNLQVLYAGFAGDGVYYTTSALQATSMAPMPGNQGVGTRLNGAGNPPAPIPVTAAKTLPTGSGLGFIALATPALTSSPLANALYQGWLYAVVGNANGSFNGLYVTKDFGANWTLVRLPDFAGFGTNDPNQNDVPLLLSGVTDYNLSAAVDPNNPNIVYMGTWQAGEPGNVIRVDLTKLQDPYDTVGYTDSLPDGGLPRFSTTAAVTVTQPGQPYGLLPGPRGPYLNLLTDPTTPFDAPSTQYFTNVSTFDNTGLGATWSAFQPVISNHGVRALYAVTDPLSGEPRLIFANDQGIFTATDNGSGLVQGPIGTVPAITGSRNGNIQGFSFFYGAAQPSVLAAQMAQALFYGNSLDNGFPHSDPNILTDGNLVWNGIFGTGGGGVATDPSGSGLLYQYIWPNSVNYPGLTPNDFFIVTPPGGTPISRTTGLILPGDNPGANQGEWPIGGAGSNFAVNPIDPSAIVMSSQVGRIFRTSGPTLGYGKQWFVIGNPSDLDGTYAPALAFGAPNPAAPGVLDDFIYAGTTGGNVFVTFGGGGTGGWTKISTGLDGSAIQSISADPKRGSHDAYAVTAKGVYYMPDCTAANPTWIKLNDTAGQGTLLNLQRPIFNNPNDLYPTLLTNPVTNPLPLTSLAVDWRFAVPDSNGDGGTHPVLYVGGDGGVFRSLDKGLTWTYYPDVAQDGAVQEGGYLPNADVTSLTLSLGNINPATGQPDPSTGLNMLVASTFGGGMFAIRLDNSAVMQYAAIPMAGPVVTSVQPVIVNHGTQLAGFTITFNGAVDPTTFTTADINTLTGPGGAITPTSVQDVTPTGPGDIHNVYQINFAAQGVGGTYSLNLGPNISDFSGDLMDQDQDGVNGSTPDDQFAATYNFTPNRPPTISSIANQVILPNSSTGPLPFTVGDPDTGAASVTVTESSSNTTLVPNSNVVIQGSGANYTVDVTPAAGQHGITTITLTATDPQGLATSTSFTVTVDPGPQLQPIPDQFVAHGKLPLTVPVSATDPDGDTVTLQAAAAGYSPAYTLQQQLGLYENGSFYYNFDGMKEEWLYSAVQNRYYVILPDGEVRPASTLTNPATTLVTLDPRYWQDPTLIFNAPAPTTPATVTVSGSNLNVNAPAGDTGTFQVTVTASDGLLTSTQTFLVHVTDQAPVLQPVPDQTVLHDRGAFNVTLNASDPDAGDKVTFGATVTGYSPAYTLQQQLGLYENGSFYYNFDGMKEEWLYSAVQNRYYVILPDGEVRPASTLTNPATTLVTLDPRYWQDPTLIFNAPAPAVPTVNGVSATASVSGNTLTVTPPPGYVGTFAVVVTGSDSILTTTETFLVHVTDQTPLLQPIADQTLPPGGSTKIAVTATDPDAGDTVTLGASVAGYSAAAELQRQLGLYFNGSFYQNYDGLNEKWVYSAVQNRWYVILPDGEVRPGSTATNPATTLVTLPVSYYMNPTSLFQATTPPAPTGASATLSGNVLTVNAPAGFSGQFRVTVTATDGALTATQQFLVNVTTGAPGNLTPLLSPIQDQTTPHNQALAPVPVTAADPDADKVNLQAFVSLTGPAADLQRQLGLYFNGSYYQNFDGLNEKWLYSATQQQWYVILPDGEVRSGKAPTNPASTVATLDSSYWQDPNLIYAPPLPALSAGFTGNNLVITNPTNYAGTFRVTVTASDGTLMSSQPVLVTVTNQSPQLGGVADQTTPHNQQLAPIALSATDANGDAVNVQPFVSATGPAATLQQQLGLYLNGSYYQNFDGLNEKWLYSATQRQWYVILPDGEVRPANTITNPATDVATLDSSYWQDPNLIYAPPLPAVTATVTGGNLTVKTPANYTGTFQVGLTASDGLTYDAQRFTVSVTDKAPLLQGIFPQRMSASQHSLTVTPTVSDPNGDTVNLQGVVSLTGPAATLEQQLGLYLNGSYYQNFDGLNEKWLYSATQQAWYIILPDGEVRPAAFATNPAKDVATLDPSYWQNPSLIFAPTLPATVSVSGGNVTVTPVAGHTGTFYVTVVASDGVLETQQRFLFTVTM